MTGAELRTLRDSLGLSAEQVAVMAGVRGRTVQRWEVDDWPVPSDVAEQLHQIDGLLEKAVRGAEDALLDAQKRAQGAPADVVLVRYRTDADLARYRPDMAAWPTSVHGALIDRVRVAFMRAATPTRIVWMNAEAYEAWRGQRKDTEPLRAQWAAEQLRPPE